MLFIKMFWSLKCSKHGGGLGKSWGAPFCMGDHEDEAWRRGGPWRAPGGLTPAATAFGENRWRFLLRGAFSYSHHGLLSVLGVRVGMGSR